MSGGLFHHKTCDTKPRLTGKTCLFIKKFIHTLFVVFTTWKRQLKKEEEEKHRKVRFPTGHTRTTWYSFVASNIECEITEFCTMKVEFRGWGMEVGKGGGD